MIAEYRHFMRGVAFESARMTPNAADRLDFIDRACRLAEARSKVGKSVAGLRGCKTNVREVVQRIRVEDTRRRKGGRVPKKIRRNAQIEIKLLGTDDVWHPHRGAPFGNRRAWKTGRNNAQWRRLTRAADIAQTLNEIFGGSPGHTNSPAGSNAVSQQAAVTMPPSGGSASGPPPPPPPAVPGFPGAGASQETVGTRAVSASGSADAPQIVTDDNNNALIIRADAAEYDSIDKIIRQMDITPNQVMIEATIVEVTLNDDLKYGVEWYFKSGNQTFTQAATGIPLTSFPGFGYTYSVPNVSVAMSALGTLSKINVISSPKLLTLDNMPATLEVGDQVPIITQTSTSTDSNGAPVIATVQQRDTGVLLSVTPRIGSSGVVYLTIAQEVSDVVPTTTSNIDSPTIQQRKIQATVAITDGNTVALGGMMRRAETTGNSGVPYLKDIPVLGGLFGTQSSNRERTELLIFLTPRVVRSPPAAAAVTDDLRKALDGVRETIEYFASRNKDIPRLPWR